MATTDATLSSFVCTNCLKEVPVENQVAHMSFCSRNIVRCATCTEPVRTQNLAEHIATHQPVRCPQCGEDLEQRKLDDHVKYTCKKRSISCPYCAMENFVDEYDAHESYCGSRTDKCATCSKYIKLRDMKRHMESKCNFPPRDQILSERESETEKLLDFIRESVISASENTIQESQAGFPQRPPSASNAVSPPIECPWCMMLCRLREIQKIINMNRDYESVQMHMLTECPHRSEHISRPSSSNTSASTSLDSPYVYSTISAHKEKHNNTMAKVNVTKQKPLPPPAPKPPTVVSISTSTTKSTSSTKSSSKHILSPPPGKPVSKSISAVYGMSIPKRPSHSAPDRRNTNITPGAPPAKSSSSSSLTVPKTERSKSHPNVSKTTSNVSPRFAAPTRSSSAGSRLKNPPASAPHRS